MALGLQAQLDSEGIIDDGGCGGFLEIAQETFIHIQGATLLKRYMHCLAAIQLQKDQGSLRKIDSETLKRQKKKFISIRTRTQRKKFFAVVAKLDHQVLELLEKEQAFSYVNKFLSVH